MLEVAPAGAGLTQLAKHWLEQNFLLDDAGPLAFLGQAPGLVTVLEEVLPVVRRAYPHEEIWLRQTPLPCRFYHLPQDAPVLQVVPFAWMGVAARDLETDRLWRVIETAGRARLRFYWKHEFPAGPVVTFIPWQPADWQQTPYQPLEPTPSEKGGT